MVGPRAKTSSAIFLLLVFAVACSTGCVQLISHLGYWSGAAHVPAAYDDLEEQRVAVVCVSDAASYGTGSEADMLARMVGRSLAENIDEIEVVPARWICPGCDRRIESGGRLQCADCGRPARLEHGDEILLRRFELQAA